MLFAAGGVAAEQLLPGPLRLVKPVLAAAMIILGAIIAPTVIPILPPEKLLGYMKAIHFEPPRTETSQAGWRVWPGNAMTRDG